MSENGVYRFFRRKAWRRVGTGSAGDAPKKETQGSDGAKKSIYERLKPLPEDHDFYAEAREREKKEKR